MQSGGGLLGMDGSNGYEAMAEQFIATRNPRMGAEIVRAWVDSLPAGAAVLDLGCGHGEPIGRILCAAQCRIFAVDASERLLQEFRKRFPAASAELASVEESRLFLGSFDGIVACGLLFLLAAETQKLVLRKAAKALNPEGKLLFTAPREAAGWRDALTGKESISLGREAYRRILEAEGLVLQQERRDEGGNHYYFASKKGTPAHA